MPGMGWHYGPCNPKTMGSGGLIVLIILAIVVGKNAHGIEHAIGEFITIGEIVMPIIVALVIYGTVKAIINANKGAVCLCNKCQQSHALPDREPLRAYVIREGNRASVSDTIVRPVIDRGHYDYGPIDNERDTEYMDSKNTRRPLGS